jgi:hypothetical protein
MAWGLLPKTQGRVLAAEIPKRRYCMVNMKAKLMSGLFASMIIGASGMSVSSTAASAAQAGVGAGAGAAVQGPAGASVGVGVQGGASGAAGLDRSSQQMSTQGTANSNAQGRAGANTGLERAQQRMNPQALEHAKSLEAEGGADASAKARGKLK